MGTSAGTGPLRLRAAGILAHPYRVCDSQIETDSRESEARIPGKTQLHSERTAQESGSRPLTFGSYRTRTRTHTQSNTMIITIQLPTCSMTACDQRAHDPKQATVTVYALNVNLHTVF